MFSELTRTSRSMSDQHELEERVKTAQAECERLREENVRLRAMLSIHDPVLEHPAPSAPGAAPKPLPGRSNFWSVVAYDADSRSILRNGQPFPSVSTYTEPQLNCDGSIDVYFSPETPAGKEKNWIQTNPGKGWFTLFRFYGPLEPFFDKTWKPDDIVEIK
jgi:hypothetical protein